MLVFHACFGHHIAFRSWPWTLFCGLFASACFLFNPFSFLHLGPLYSIQPPRMILQIPVNVKKHWIVHKYDAAHPLSSRYFSFMELFSMHWFNIISCFQNQSFNYYNALICLHLLLFFRWGWAVMIIQTKLPCNFSNLGIEEGLNIWSLKLILFIVEHI